MDKISTLAKKYWKHTAIGATIAFASAAVYAASRSSDDTETDTTETD